MDKRRYIYSLSLILLLIVVAAGWFATDYLGDKARQEIIGESQASILTLSTHISSTLDNLGGAAESLAGSPLIASALPSKGAQELEHANSALDRYNSSLKISVSYLMDADGLTVAASNRHDPDSFLGESYRFRPYFQEAAKGRAGHYFAMGITSGKRGYYASHPVQDRSGAVVGVVTMKRNLDEMETFISKYPFCFLISPEGIIFLSSTPSMVLKSLWPLDEATRGKLIASRQFGDKPFEAVMEKEIADGTEVALNENGYFVSRAKIGRDGWSIVLLTPTDRIRVYKLAGILATISIGFLIIVFLGTVYAIDQSHETMRQNEEHRRLLLNAAGEGIFGIDTAGQLTFVNPAALSMLGFSEEEMIGRDVHNLIHHSHKDGSRYSVEDCPMYNSCAQATNTHVADEILWRKDGSSFPVEYASMPITKDGRLMGAVVTFSDITARKRAEKALRESEEKYRSIFDNAPLGLLHINKEGVMTSCNDKLVEIIGSSREALIGLKMLDLPDKKIVGAVKQALDGKSGYYDDDYRSFTSHKVTPIHALFAPIIFEKGEIIGGIGIIDDITERKRAEEVLRESEERFRQVVDNMSEVFWLRSADNLNVLYVSPAYERIWGRTRQSLYDNPDSFIDSVADEDKPMVIERFNAYLEGGSFDLEYRIVRPDGGIRWVWSKSFPVRDDQGNIVRHTGMGMDITEHKQAQEKIHQMAYHDYLTSLPNRKLFSDRLHIALAQAQRNQRGVTVILLDIDHFKDVNDTLGHDVGDLLLKAAAERLSATLRKSDTVARYGGDEFALILPDLKEVESVIRVGRKIVDSFREPFLLGTHQLIATTSIGIALYPDDGTDEATLLKNADIAMYQAKQTGRNRYKIFEKS